MSIHENKNNLGETDFDDLIEQNEPTILNEDDDEMNPYAAENDGIHAANLSPSIGLNNNIENIHIEFNEEEYNKFSDELMNESHDDMEMSAIQFIDDPKNNDEVKKLIINQVFRGNINKLNAKKNEINRRNDIMRSVTTGKFNNTSNKEQIEKKVKESLKLYTPRSNNHSYNPTKLAPSNPIFPKPVQIITSSTNITSNNCHSMLPNHRLTMLRSKPIELPPSPYKNDDPISLGPTPIREVPNLQIRNIPGQKSHGFNFDLPNKFLGNDQGLLAGDRGWDYTALDPIQEKPNQMSLAEIVTKVLQEVITGKVTDIETAIGKLRTNYEDNNIFANNKKHNIILLNFDDDMMRPVFKIEEKYLDIIKNWYSICDISIDIEETECYIPEMITSQDISGVLFQDINYKFKDEYLNNYIPIVINNIMSNRAIKVYETKYFEKPVTYVNEQKGAFGTKDILQGLGVSLPNNIIPDEFKPLNHNNFQYDPNIIELKQHILPDIGYYNKLNNLVDGEVCAPYNTVESHEIKPYKKGNYLSFNVDYDVLSPEFGDFCEVIIDIDDFIKNKDKQKRTVSSVFVLINEKYLQTITIENPENDVLYIIKNYPEFGFIKLFGITTNNNDIIKFIEREFNNETFNDIDEVNKKLMVVSQYIEFSNKHNDTNTSVLSEENQVKKFLNFKYTINNDINFKMKASVLHDAIINSNYVKISPDKLTGFKNRLSKYLKDIGLQKKRYNDGFYYYGILEKEPYAEHNSRDNKPNLDTLKEYIMKRDEEKKNYKFTLEENGYNKKDFFWCFQFNPDEQ